jgi:hypothetical protein
VTRAAADILSDNSEEALMTNQLTWTQCKWFAADEAEGADGLTYYVCHSYPTATCSGAYYPEVRRSLKGKPMARLGEFPMHPNREAALAAARSACEADHAERLARIADGGTGGSGDL